VTDAELTTFDDAEEAIRVQARQLRREQLEAEAAAEGVEGEEEREERERRDAEQLQQLDHELAGARCLQPRAQPCDIYSYLLYIRPRAGYSR
jgi:hypothetical protein